MAEKEKLDTVTVNGVCLHYLCEGEGRPVVLLHGNGEDHHLFDVLTRQLVCAGYRVYAPDSRGHGANEPLTEYHYADMAEDVYAFIRALGLERPALYGHSDGGIVALLTELAHPGTLGIMAVSGANLSPEGLDPGFAAACRAQNALSPDPLVTLMLTEPRISLRSLRGIAVPVLVAAGEADVILRAETERIAAALPDAVLCIVKGADHGSYIAGSGIIGEMLEDFLASRGY